MLLNEGTARKNIDEIYKRNLETDIIKFLAKKKNIDYRDAADIYYSSKLAQQIEEGKYGIENLDAKNLVEELIENG